MIETIETTEAAVGTSPAARSDTAAKQFIDRLRSMRQAARLQRLLGQSAGGLHATPIGDSTCDRPDGDEPTACDSTTLLRSVASALAGKNGDDAARIARVGLAIVDPLLRKNADYAGSVWRAPVLCPSLPIESAILCRMSDKVARLANLHGREQDAAVAEPIEDTLADLAGYAMLYLARPAESERGRA